MEMTSEEARLRTRTLPDVSTATNVEGDRGLGLHSNGRESKVKFLCSYGGKIMPRPSDQKLRYVGGETRVISIPRDLHFDGLKLLLRQTYGLDLTLKYQLPGEELDALVSVSSEEDFKNMMEEYDRLDGLDDSSRRRIFVFSFRDNPNPIDLIENTDPKVVEQCFVEAVNDISMKKMDNNVTMDSMRSPSPFPSCSVANDSQLHGVAVVEGNDSEHHDGRYIPRNADAFLHAKRLEPGDLVSSSTSPGQLVPISEVQTHIESRQIKTNMDLLDERLIGDTQVQQIQGLLPIKILYETDDDTQKQLYVHRSGNDPGKDSQNNSLSPGAKLQELLLDETVELEVDPETSMSDINMDVNIMADRRYFAYFSRETPEQDARTHNVVNLLSANDQISTGQSLSIEACVYPPLMAEKIEERYFSNAPNVVEISTGQSLSIEALCSALMVEEIEERDFSLQTRRDAVIEDLKLEGTFDTAYDIPMTFTDYAMKETRAHEHLQIIPNNDLQDLKEIGSGTFGIVYYGKWKGTDVAIKRIKSDCFKGNLTEQKRLIEDFWREASILGQLHHPNVLAFYGVVTDGPENSLATVTEYMVDGSLRQALSRNHRKFDHQKRLLIAMDIAFGMEYLHGKKVVHFDLKSGNLLVNLRDPQRPVCKIGDLGMSKVKKQTWTTGGVRGTLPWMAPELLNGISNLVSDKVDVFSFGIVLWELLTGEEPYANMHYGAIIGGIVNNTLRPPIPEACDNAWRSLMEACWSVDATERPAFSEIAQTLQEMEATISATKRQEANTK